MKKVFKIHVVLPDNFTEQKIIGYFNPDSNLSEIILTGYLKYPTDSSQSMKAEIRIPYSDTQQGMSFKEILSGRAAKETKQ